MKKLLVITGANRGLGEAIVDLALQDSDAQVISTSRSLSPKHADIDEAKMLFLETDLSAPFSMEVIHAISRRVEKNTILYLINNAGVILPIDSIGELEEKAVETSLNVNVQYPVNLINAVVKKFPENQIVLTNITSGAGNRPLPHWGMYCASKAFMKMFFKVLGEEQKENGKIQLFEIDPGTMDTGMQEKIRGKEFPGQDYFTSLKDNDKLVKPADAALKILTEINFHA